MPYVPSRCLRIKTERTRLRPPTPDDAEALFPSIHDAPAVTRWLCTTAPAVLSELRDEYANWRRGTHEEPIYLLVVEDLDRDSPAPIGQVSLRFDGHPNVCDIGFWLGESHQNRGHGSDLVRLAVTLAFERMGAWSVIANVKRDNDRSLAVLERTGFVRTRAPSGTEVAWILTLSRREYRGRDGSHGDGIHWE